MLTTNSTTIIATHWYNSLGLSKMYHNRIISSRFLRFLIYSICSIISSFYSAVPQIKQSKKKQKTLQTHYQHSMINKTSISLAITEGHAYKTLEENIK